MAVRTAYASSLASATSGHSPSGANRLVSPALSSAVSAAPKETGLKTEVDSGWCVRNGAGQSRKAPKQVGQLRKGELRRQRHYHRVGLETAFDPRRHLCHYRRMHRQKHNVLRSRHAAISRRPNTGDWLLSFASDSGLQSLTTMSAGKLFARAQPARKMRVIRPPPINPMSCCSYLSHHS